jgi:hypothetical protein
MKHEKIEIELFIKNKDPLLEFSKPKQTTKSSPLWSSFHQVFYKKVKQDVIRCDTCKSIFIHRSIDGTKVMSNHLKACKQMNKSDTNQQNLDVYFSSKNQIAKRIASKIKKSITDACVEFAALDNRAFETVKGDGFVNLMEKVFVAGQRLSGSSDVKVAELLPDPTTVNRWHAL